jgi:hypothetical protein
MKHSLLTAALVAAVVATVPAAHATHTITLTPPAADGSISGTFQNNSLAAGAFTNSFDFALPTDGFINGTISSIFRFLQSNNVDFTAVALNGNEFTIGSSGNVEFRFLEALGVLSGMQMLTVSGLSGGNGSYAGTLSFAPSSAVPEPATWAFFAGGFGLIGGVLRRRRMRPLSVLA